MIAGPTGTSMGPSGIDGSRVLGGGGDRESHGRNRRLALGIVSAALTRPAAVLFQLVSVPLLYAYLGRETYGLFETISSLAVWMSLANAGISLGLLNGLIDCYVAGDTRQARRYVASTALPLAGIVVGAAFLVFAVAPLVPWADLLGVDARTGHQPLALALSFAAVATLGAVLGSVPTAVYSAYQETHKNSYWDAAGKLAAVAACFAVVRTRLGLIGAVLAAAAVPALVRIINGVYLLWREKRWLLPRRADFDRQLFLSTMKQSAVFFGLQTTVMLLYQTDRVIVSVLGGPGAAADYAIPNRVFVLMYGVVAMIHTPLWTSHGEAVRRGDLRWVRRAVTMTVLVSCGACLVVGLLMVTHGDLLLRTWLRAELVAPAPLVVAFTFAYLTRAWVDSRSLVLNSAGILRPQLAFWLANAALAVGLALVLGRRFGATGVAWAYPIAAVLTTVWGYPWMMRRYVYRRGGPHTAGATA